jgi:hypothetical protein
MLAKPAATPRRPLELRLRAQMGRVPRDAPHRARAPVTRAASRGKPPVRRRTPLLDGDHEPGPCAVSARVGCLAVDAAQTLDDRVAAASTTVGHFRGRSRRTRDRVGGDAQGCSEAQGSGCERRRLRRYSERPLTAHMNSMSAAMRDPRTATTTDEATRDTRSRDCPPAARAGSREPRLRRALTSARPSRVSVSPTKNETRPAIPLTNAVIPKSVTRTRKTAARSTATKSHDRPIRGQRQFSSSAF